MKLYYLAKPYKVNQVWGVSRPEIYKQFGFTKHNGEDIALGNDKCVYSPIAATVYRKLWQPNGGGVVLSLLTDTTKFPDGKECKVLIDLMHLEKILVEEGNKVEIGQKLAVADNTGFSTGSHTHIQMRRVKDINGYLIDVDKNEANNSFDHAIYYSGIYAQDYLPASPNLNEPDTIKLQKSFLSVLKSYIEILKTLIK